MQEHRGDQAAQAELDTFSQLRNTMQTGSNLRGSLLQAYGWEQVGTNVKVAGYLVFEVLRGHQPANER